MEDIKLLFKTLKHNTHREIYCIVFHILQNVKYNSKPMIRMQKHLFVNYTFMDWWNFMHICRINAFQYVFSAGFLNNLASAH